MLTRRRELGYAPVIGSEVHLPVDYEERRRVVDGLRQRKIDEATAFLVTKCSLIDLNREYRHVEQWESEEGDRIMAHWEVTPLKGEDLTAFKAFDAMMFLMRMQELVMTEHLGGLSIRESDVGPDHPLEAEQVRLLASHDNGVLSEANFIVHSAFQPSSALVAKPHGVLSVDFVDCDEVFPYASESRIRKDIVSANMVVEVGPRTVALVRWASMQIHASEHLTPAVIRALPRDGIGLYFDAMLKSMKSHLHILS